MLNLEYYHNTPREWLTALAILIGIAATLTVARQIVARRVRRHAIPPVDGAGHAGRVAADFVGRTSVLFFIALGVAAGSMVLSLPPRADTLVRAGALVTLLLQVGLWGDGLVNVVLTRYVAHHIAANGEDGGGIATSRTTMAALSIFVRGVLWILLVLVALDSLGVRVTTLITGLGVTGIALALAVQNILGDLFAALSIVVDKPFVDGDWIAVDTFSGTVEHIGLKTTRLRAFTGEQIVFSNTDLLKSRIRNYRRLKERTATLTLTLDQSVPSQAVARVPPTMREIVQAQPQVRFERSHVTTPTMNGTGVETVYTVLSADYVKFMDAQQAITVALLDRLPALGVKLASSGGVTVIQRPG